MTDNEKPVHTLELTVDADATPEQVWKAITEAAHVANWFAPQASTKGTGVGSTITASWGAEMEASSVIGAWEPGRHVQWVNDDMFGPGTRMVTDWYITSEGGKTRLRLVQSGFGAFDGWDDFFSGTETGWKYFLHNLRAYLERHLGKTRRMISSRFPVGIPRADAWRKVLTGAGLVMAANTAVSVGDEVQLALADKPMPAVVEILIAEHAIALRIPSLGDALLFVEFEGGGDSFSIGAWLSVYDADAAGRIEVPAKRAFERLATALR